MNISKKTVFACAWPLLACMAASGADFEDNGIYYNILSPSTVEVTCPTGYNEKFNDPDSYGSRYAGDIVIPETVEYNKSTYTVVKIGDNAFRGCFDDTKSQNLTSVTMPSTVTEIGTQAFTYRQRLTSAPLSPNLEKLGDYAYMSTSISEIEIPGTVKNTGFQTFFGCGKLEYLILHEGTETIGNQCFCYCEWLEFCDKNKTPFTTVPSTVTRIGSNAFSNCTYIYNFVVPETVVWDEAMSWCGFDGCTRLENVWFSNGIKTMGNYCLRKTKISEFTLRAGLQSISYDVFVDCDYLTKIIVEESETPLSCWNAPYSNTKPLQSLHIGREVSPFIFSNQEEITDVTVLCNKVLETPVFADKVYENATLTVPAGMKEAFRAHAQWGKFKTIVDGTEEPEPWISDLNFGEGTEDGTITLTPKHLIGLIPVITPADAEYSSIDYALTEAGDTRDNLIASMYKVNYWNPGRIQFYELSGHRIGQCKLTVTVTPKDTSAEPYVREFTVNVTDPDRTPLENGYLDGTIILNEEWFTHTNGGLNYITEDNEWIYQAYERENPGMSFGATSQYGIIWADKLIVASKQHADGGDPLPGGGRLVIADAKTLKRLGSIDILADPTNSADTGGDGRAVAGATPDKIYVGTTNGICIVDISNPTAPVVTGKISVEDDGNNTDLYNGQIGDMLSTGKYVFGIKQSTGVFVIDITTDRIIKLIEDANVQGITQSLDGRVWYATYTTDGTSTCSEFVALDPETLEESESVVIPAECGRVACGWGAWRSTQFFGSLAENELWFVTGAAGIAGGSNGYYRYRIGESTEGLQPFFSLKLDGKEPKSNGTFVQQKTYGTSRFDARNNRLIVMTTENSASGHYRNNWTHFVDGSTGEITESFYLEPYYWFQCLPIFPDKYLPELNPDFAPVVFDLTTLPSEETNPEAVTTQTVDLGECVSDLDNLSANIRFSIPAEAAQADEADEDAPVAEYALEGNVLTITPKKAGETNILVTAESNGRTNMISVPVKVNAKTGINGLGAEKSIRTSGNHIFITGYAGQHFALYNTAGVLMAEFDADSDNFTAAFNFTPGVYVLRGENVSVKIAI